MEIGSVQDGGKLRKQNNAQRHSLRENRQPLTLFSTHVNFRWTLPLRDDSDSPHPILSISECY